MAGLTRARHIGQQLRLRGRYQRLFSSASGPRPRSFALRYGSPCLIAAAALGVVCSPQFALKRLIHNDAPKGTASWFSGSDLQADTSISAEEAEEKLKESENGNGSGQQEPPPQSTVAEEENDNEDESSPWYSFTTGLFSASTSLSSLSSLGDTLADYVIPKWAKLLPALVTKLQNELSAAPGTLAEEIWYEANNPECHPEIIWDATVRVSNDLCQEEKNYLQKRKLFTRRALARYLDIPEEKIHPDDVPVIAMCGSGGGLRALVAGTSSYLSAREHGLFDCLTYTAGVSGSCWLQTLFYSNIAEQSHRRLIRHLKNRLGVHIAYPPDALELLASAPTNKFLLAGLIEKARGVPDAEFGIVDIYGLLLAARLLVPKGELSVDEYDFKLSHQRRYTDDGSNPLPIYTAVRHEIPLVEQIDMQDPVIAKAKAKKEQWFQWFEFTPYEFWCEEIEAGIPTWALGRKFINGRTLWRENGLALPELRVPQLMGIWGSAFCATLSHYYKEVRPAVKGLTGFTSLDDMIAGRDDDLVKLHPINPASIPNFAYGMKDHLPSTCPESMYDAPNLQLMDAGMSNNLPIYPLLRPGRNVDILIAFDASADVKTDNWLKVTEGYARQRGIKGWPVGAGWPPEEETMEEIQQDLERAQAKSEEQAEQKVQDAKDQERQLPRRKDNPKELSYCNIWVGTTEERKTDDEPPPSKQVADDEDWELMSPDAGITVIYFPFLANPKVEGVDPKTSDFMSTWNFVYTPEQIDSVVELARTNFQEGAERTKRTVRAVYERKKRIRELREEEERERRRRWMLRQGRAGGRRIGEGDHGDHFS
ncbi:cytosolic phospholipase A2 zeta [Westerdykella ornata]|uniref:Lysophospholipase n=1 Tax=Westerdykella ornata TaxID=318751 RepID=A0A6A6JRU1_WESOR|nr:cytosolic phospholipase A2 zeta [Westerdykella ornata]KAF2279320.1 cytosolic phospholipase A2 zeta [Westerdykella ornata]